MTSCMSGENTEIASPTTSSIREKSDTISVYNCHQRMGHGSMKTIVEMTNSAVTGMVPKDIPEGWATARPALGKAQSFPFKTGHSRATTQLEIIHDDLVCYMPVVSVSRRKYGFVVMDEYSPASLVLPFRAKSDAPAELEGWAAKMENATKSHV